MTISPGNLDLTIYQGATFSQVFTWNDQTGNPVNLTGYSGRMMARATPDASQPFISLSTAGGGMALGGSAGTITLTMSAAQTQALTIFGGSYDLSLTDASGNVSRLLQGNITVNRDITR